MTFGRNVRLAARGVEKKKVKAYMSDKHAANNRAAAAIILGNVEKYGGVDSGVCQWARIFQARDAKEQSENNRSCTTRPAGQQIFQGF